MNDTGRTGGVLSKFSLQDKIAIVTGAGRGIGKGIALAFADAGADVVVAARTENQIKQTAEEIVALGRRALVVPTDVTDGEQVRLLVYRATRQFGRIDILVNNVGSSIGFRMSPLGMPEEVWDKAMAVNLKSTFLCTKAVAGAMIQQQRRGSIINIASGAGKHGQLRSIAYGTAKAGVIHFTLCMSNYLAPHGIRVNCVCPGHTATGGTRALGSDKERVRENAIPLMRIGRPEDVALAAIYLASAAADYVTGVTIEVSGGEYLGGISLKLAEQLWAVEKPGA